MRCPDQARAQTGPTLPAVDTMFGPAAYARADRPDTGRLAHPRAPRMPSGLRPFLGDRVGGQTPMWRRLDALAAQSLTPTKGATTYGRCQPRRTARCHWQVWC